MQRCMPKPHENTAGHATAWSLEYAQTIKQQQQAPECKNATSTPNYTPITLTPRHNSNNSKRQNAKTPQVHQTIRN